MDQTLVTPEAAKHPMPGLLKLLLAAVVLGALSCTFWFGVKFSRQRDVTTEKAVQSNLSQLLAAVEQHALESPERLFLRFQDIYGEKAYLKSVRPVRDEDYHSLFPYFVPDHRYSLSIRLPDGRTIQYDRNRVARPLPPDGTHTELLPNGGRCETTWRNGMRDGPMRAWRADGSLWCEAYFERGRVVSATHVTRNGHHLDELKGEVPD